MMHFFDCNICVEYLFFRHGNQLFQRVQFVANLKDCTPEKISICESLKEVQETLIRLKNHLDCSLVFIFKILHFFHEIVRIWSVQLVTNQRYGDLVSYRLLIKCVNCLILALPKEDGDLFQLSNVAYGEYNLCANTIVHEND